MNPVNSVNASNISSESTFQVHSYQHHEICFQLCEKNAKKSLNNFPCDFYGYILIYPTAEQTKITNTS